MVFISVFSWHYFTFISITFLYCYLCQAFQETQQMLEICTFCCCGGILCSQVCCVYYRWSTGYMYVGNVCQNNSLTSSFLLCIYAALNKIFLKEFLAFAAWYSIDDTLAFKIATVMWVIGSSKLNLFCFFFVHVQVYTPIQMSKWVMQIYFTTSAVLHQSLGRKGTCKYKGVFILDICMFTCVTVQTFTWKLILIEIRHL